MQDEATTFPEIAVLQDKSMLTVAQIFDKQWLSRYPRPMQVIFDNGGEFKQEFTDMLESYGINKKPTTVKNPQSNSRHERMHQTIVEMIRTQVIICNTEAELPNEID